MVNTGELTRYWVESLPQRLFHLPNRLPYAARHCCPEIQAVRISENGKPATSSLTVVQDFMRTLGLAPLRLENHEGPWATGVESIAAAIAQIRQDLAPYYTGHGPPRQRSKQLVSTLLLSVFNEVTRQQQLQTPTVQLESYRTVSLPYHYHGTEYRLTCTVDHVLWCGLKSDLAISLVVTLKKSAMETRMLSPLASMAMIHHARKRAGKSAVMYGLYSDGDNYHFMYLNDQAEYSTISFMRLDERLPDIVRLVEHIMHEAYQAAGSGPWPMPMGGISASALSGCTITSPT
ncbi:hypothetical protein BDV28DRAFT_147693 [Aspergillus coremiiformis]|uniref:Uncharacterized protein n=1 Tax=Aspergillus coremiiformis TaxID=138285 RepID=A0A5N6Z8W1_9EURO|nr:hypothetical protein BDV28DRAFT_147693 [Aspergillus coremiiformis]